jgi:hypothetical protein
MAVPGVGVEPTPGGLEGRCSLRRAARGPWTTSVSNRAGAACKAALHTCASPDGAAPRASPEEPAPRASPESRRRGSNPLPSAYKADARPVVLHRHRAEDAGLEPARPEPKSGGLPVSRILTVPAEPSTGVEPVTPLWKSGMSPCTPRWPGSEYGSRTRLSWLRTRWPIR